MKYLVVIVILFSCSSSKTNFADDLSVSQFKERALCKCLAVGLDSSGKSNTIQKLIPYNPLASVLYDSIIDTNLKRVMEEIYIDSTKKIGRVAEAAQGRPIFYGCMKFYKSKELDKLAKTQIRLFRKIKNLDQYISSRYPTW